MSSTRNKAGRDTDFRERLLVKARRNRSKAETLQESEERTRLLTEADQLERSAVLDAWITSPALQPPT
jgi:hypothetical protein